ncbi:MmcB family DNA repair protein [Hyphococcus flavus]|uniref:MmcB family DNA repair protein n=1 Tax=Hyphococcus flavus TaxID=1866326 RepID=A0AAF0CFL7_9PROT|nr:MmcB family DNA repair protein [Hyphococcus flavus]WDI32591.1 MmcB family DNA repair protein [Hyphococcus flavus]
MQNNQLASDIARPDRTVALTRGVTRLFIDLGFSPLCEFRLANGRRADVAALDRKGRLTIAEVKSCRADFDVDEKWPEYLEYCDQFYFAVDPAFPQDILPETEGLIIADEYGAAISRNAAERPLVAARRKAVTLRFARQAAQRALLAPCEA